MSKKLALAVVLALTFKVPASMARAKKDLRPLVQEGLFIVDTTGKWLKVIKAHPDLIVDHITKRGFEVYGPFGLEKWARSLGAMAVGLEGTKNLKSGDEERLKEDLGHPNFEQWSEELKTFAAANSDIVSLFSIGKSTDGRELFMVKISDNVDQDEVEPEVKYIANMHGDEIVGRGMMLMFIRDLVEKYRQGDPSVAPLIDNTEIFIMPSMNPDGAESHRRGNRQFVDLNRDFPDFSTDDNQDTTEGRAIETQAVMNFQKERHFVLSANFHGGAQVVNYPWDTVDSAHPLLDLVIEWSRQYALSVDNMRDSREFPGGITNGYAWYEIDGGMQDWSYYWYNDLQLTIEVSNVKWPSYSEVPSFYQQNYSSLLQFLKNAHQGAGFKLADDQSGKVTITSNRPDGPYGAVSISYGPYRFHSGEFYKVLPQGQYTFDIQTDDGTKKQVQLKVAPAGPINHPNYSMIN